MEFSHISVLFNETIDSLAIKPDGLYVDCTCGGAGHSRAILERLNVGRLIAIDRDPDAIEVITERVGKNSNVKIVNDNFSNIKKILGEEKADGILADLGVSSFQLDNPERGFSFHKDAPLDMRMSKSGKSAFDVVNGYSEKELFTVISRYGEERFAGNIAKNIVRSREKKAVETTLELAEIVKNSVPAKYRRDSHPARKTFQAIRIEVNDELSTLSEAVSDMFDCLRPGGRLSIITFHSLEDRTVKEKFREFASGCTCPKDFPVCVCGKTPRGRLINRGISAAQSELDSNNRSRSARLRTIEKIK
ncbi:MAG: 16S rRNA (cytosine(1402)-N(4))-methyltransferase RsmH [Oscillospiraceae bacterium]|nr:16S rRNA (cytosine(1402)-N(4))-methyltransferase RsmH [Oscillospiraceae bacterium]